MRQLLAVGAVALGDLNQLFERVDFGLDVLPAVVAHQAEDLVEDFLGGQGLGGGLLSRGSGGGRRGRGGGYRRRIGRIQQGARSRVTWARFLTANGR